MKKGYVWYDATHHQQYWRLWESQIPTGSSLTTRNSTHDLWVIGALTRNTHQKIAVVIIIVIKGASSNAAAIMANSMVCWWMVRWRVYSCSICADILISSSSFTNQSTVLIFVEARLNQRLLLNCYYYIFIGAWKTHCMWGRFIAVHWTIQCAMYETMELLLIEFLWGPREQQGCLCSTASKQKICFMNAAYLAAAWCATSVAPFSEAFISKSRQICINVWFRQIVNTRVVNCDGNFVHNLVTMCTWTIYKARKEGQENIMGVMDINYYIYRVRHRHMCSFQGCGRISLSQQTRVQTLQRLQDSAWHWQ